MTVLYKIEKTIRNFFWGSTGGEKKLYLVSLKVWVCLLTLAFGPQKIKRSQSFSSLQVDLEAKGGYFVGEFVEGKIWA